MATPLPLLELNLPEVGPAGPLTEALSTFLLGMNDP